MVERGGGVEARSCLCRRARRFSRHPDPRLEPLLGTMSARPVVKTSTMNAVLQEAAIIAAQDAIANFTTEQEIASAIKAKFEQQFPST